MADLIWLKGLQFHDSNGDPLASGTINTFDAGTTNARTVYQDAAENTAWSATITLDSAGKLTHSVYVPAGSWKFVLKNAAGSVITTEDNIPGASAAAESFASPQEPIVTKAGNYTVTTDDTGKLFVVDSSSGSVTLSLPAAGLVASGRGISVIHNGSANSVIIDPDGSETINGLSTLTLTGAPSFTEIYSDGSSVWYAKSPLSGGQLSGALDWAAAVDVASATTTDIGAAASNLVRITGTTTITGLGTAPAGEYRWVQFGGSLTLTHNGTSLILPTGANITTAAGDTALMVSEGSGNWRSYTYQKASGVYLASTAASDTVAGVIEIAIQSEMETATDATRAVVPGRQHFHPGHPKCWAQVSVMTGTPAVVTSYNITSVTDANQGVLTVTIATDFSSANWCCVSMIENLDASLDAANDAFFTMIANGSQGAGSIQLVATHVGSPEAAQDPAVWHMVGFGDHA